jgi:hypothetical protein
MRPALRTVLSASAMIAFACLSMAVLEAPLHAQTTPWNTNGSSIWYAPSGINVGIGTTAPTAKLSIGPAGINMLPTNTQLWITGAGQHRI